VRRSIGTFTGEEDVDVEYPVAMLELLCRSHNKSGQDSRPFRYVHIGGAVSEHDQDKALWYYQKARRTRVIQDFQIHRSDYPVGYFIFPRVKSLRNLLNDV
jgi:hypothetical protein